MAWNKESSQKIAHQHEQKAHELNRALMSLQVDIDQKERLDQHLCPKCYYLGGTGEYATVSTSTCVICGETVQSRTLKHPLLCLNCADQERMCQKCGAALKD